MRRKNWINKKSFFIDNVFKNIIFKKFYNKPVYLDFYLNKNLDFFEEHGVDIYTKNLKFLKIKYNLNTVKINLFFFLNFLNFFKVFNKRYLYRGLYKLHKKNELILSPAYCFSSQYLEYRILFWNILKKNKINGFFFYKNFFKISGYANYYFLQENFLKGYNFYIIKPNVEIFDYLNKSFKDKEFNRIGKIKFFLDLEAQFNFNYYFAYNIFLLNSIEYYKILMYLHIFIKN